MLHIYTSSYVLHLSLEFVSSPAVAHTIARVHGGMARLSGPCNGSKSIDTVHTQKVTNLDTNRRHVDRIYIIL